jgi:hypothetical protein
VRAVAKPWLEWRECEPAKAPAWLVWRKDGVTEVKDSSGVTKAKINAGGDSFFSGGGVAIGGTTVSSKAILDLQSTTKGFLPPKMTTTQRDAISTPTTGLIVYNTTTNKLQCYNGTGWIDCF